MTDQPAAQGADLMPGTDSRQVKAVIRLAPGQKLLVVRREATPAVRNGRAGKWVQVITPENDIGWCFDPDLAAGD